MNYWEQFINKRVKVVFDDGNSISVRNSTLTGYNENFLFIEEGERGSEAIAISKVIRIEFLEEGK